VRPEGSVINAIWRRSWPSARRGGGYGSGQQYTYPTDSMKAGILSLADGFKNVG
jgi:hypothetical protein